MRPIIWDPNPIGLVSLGKRKRTQECRYKEKDCDIMRSSEAKKRGLKTKPASTLILNF